MKTWQLEEAKRNFSKVVKLALEQGPQLITRRGEKLPLLFLTMNIPEQRNLTPNSPNSSAHLRSPKSILILAMTRVSHARPQSSWECRTCSYEGFSGMLG